MKKTIIAIVFVVMFALPIGLIVWLSSGEMKQYEHNTDFNIEPFAYGEIDMVTRKDMEEYFILEGKFVSEGFIFEEIGDVGTKTIKALVAPGDEVKKGDAIIEIGKNTYYCQHNGIVVELSTFGKAFLKLENIDKLMFEFAIDNSMKIDPDKEYKTENGSVAKLSFISNVIENGKRIARLSINGGDYLLGQEMKLKLLTGKVFESVLVVKTESVYQKDKDGPYYVRTTDSSGYVLTEVEVKIGYKNEEYICITGVPEDTCCDMGYGSLFFSNPKNNSNESGD
ncbi:MAG: hypothetical protein RRY79_01530 [Clostridia bacterium]